MQHSIVPSLLRELTRLARFGANLADAYSCLIFLPHQLLVSSSGRGVTQNGASIETSLDLVGSHTLSNELLSGARIPLGSGLIGWVATHGRSIHVSPFDRDSTTLGVYSSDQHLKSFIGVPIEIPGPGTDTSNNSTESAGLRGVLTCDSKKSFAFSKLQGKLLEELSTQISSTIQLIRRTPNKTEERSWSSFVAHSLRLVEALGVPSVDALRVRVSNLDQLEAGAGSLVTIELMDQVQRLIQQALPPHFPVCRMPQGDIVLLIDNMMAGFYENKIRAICDRITQPHGIMQIDFAKRTLRDAATQSRAVSKGTEFGSTQNIIERAVAQATQFFNPTNINQANTDVSPMRNPREYRTA